MATVSVGVFVPSADRSARATAPMSWRFPSLMSVAPRRFSDGSLRWSPGHHAHHAREQPRLASSRGCDRIRTITEVQAKAGVSARALRTARSVPCESRRASPSSGLPKRNHAKGTPSRLMRPHRARRLAGVSEKLRLAIGLGRRALDTTRPDLTAPSPRRRRIPSRLLGRRLRRCRPGPYQVAPAITGLRHVGRSVLARRTEARIGRASFQHAVGGLPMDRPFAPCDGDVMDNARSRLPDEVHGARAAGSLLVGDIGAVEAELAHVRTRYLLGFVCRLAVVTPSVALRLALRVGVRRLRSARYRGSRPIPVGAGGVVEIVCGPVLDPAYSHTTPSPSPSRM